jgi:hypothetical protein
VSIHTDDATAYAAEQVAAERRAAYALLAVTLADIHARNPDFDELYDDLSGLTMAELISEAESRSLCAVSANGIEIFAETNSGLEYTPPGGRIQDQAEVRIMYGQSLIEHAAELSALNEEQKRLNAATAAHHEKVRQFWTDCDKRRREQSESQQAALACDVAAAEAGFKGGQK